MGPDVVHQRESIFQRHFDVCDNQVRFELEVLDVTVLPVCGGLDPMRAVLQNTFQGFCHEFVVIDYQYFHFFHLFFLE
jgi:hypothetical protein